MILYFCNIAIVLCFSCSCLQACRWKEDRWQEDCCGCGERSYSQDMETKKTWWVYYDVYVHHKVTTLTRFWSDGIATCVCGNVTPNCLVSRLSKRCQKLIKTLHQIPVVVLVGDRGGCKAIIMIRPSRMAEQIALHFPFIIMAADSQLPLWSMMAQFIVQ